MSDTTLPADCLRPGALLSSCSYPAAVRAADTAVKITEWQTNEHAPPDFSPPFLTHLCLLLLLLLSYVPRQTSSVLVAVLVVVLTGHSLMPQNDEDWRGDLMDTQFDTKN